MILNLQPRAAMKKLSILFFGLLSCIWAPLVNGQSAVDDATANSRINIIGSIEVRVQNQLDFGTIAVGSATTVTLDPNTGAVTAGNGAVTVGKFRIQGEGPQTVLVNFGSTNPDANVLFTPSVTGATGNNAQASSVALSDGAQVSLSNGGRYHVWIGGTLDISSATAGVYSGSFTLTATYVF